MSDWSLQRNGFEPRPGPVMVVVLDGVGIGPEDEGNAVLRAYTPVLDRLWRDHPTTTLQAHGTAVGLPSDKDMGNSEVGHNALGAGRVFDQGAKLVDKAIADGSLFAGQVWQELLGARKAAGKPVHLIGLLSDGNVHSHIDQLKALIERCHEEGLAQLRVHPLLDGRDVGPQTSLRYIDALEQLLERINGAGGRDYRIASGGGRMLVTMDRYEANWQVVERGWKAHVLGQGRRFRSAREAIETYRTEDPEVSDQFLGEFVIVDGDGQPVGTIDDGDGVIFFNFRGDRALEITRAFDDQGFAAFDRQRVPDVFYAGMMQYDGDLQLPRRFLVAPPKIDRTMGEYLARNAVAQLAVAETQKFGHVTYFWNGNRTGKFVEDAEHYVDVPSDRVPFEQRPWMKAAEVTDTVIEQLRGGAARFIRVNYANGDMVGHTGDMQAAMAAVGVVDLCLGRLLEAVDRAGGIAIVTADHGNADEMYQRDKKTKAFARDADGDPLAKTSHTLNPVPLTIYDPAGGASPGYALDPSIDRPRLSNVAATALTLLGFRPPPSYDPPLVRL